LKIHEYQAKELLKGYGVTVPLSIPAKTAADAGKAAAKLIADTGNDVVVVKSQIHAGGRGKGRFKEHPDLGGVKVVKGADVAKQVAEQMLGSTLVTIQTGEDGKRVDCVLIEQGMDIDRELYVGAVLDRERQRVCLMASAEGGVEIEEVAEKNPDAIKKAWIDPAVGPAAYQARKLALDIGLTGQSFKNAVPFFTKLATAFVDEDCSTAEINPLVVTKSGDVLALDAKIELDDNASFRHPTWEALRDMSEEEPSEREADAHQLSYVKLDGSIGCMVNGAGLAMATMDIIKSVGGEPANFLDVGGGASKERVAAAFKIILADKNVKGIFINIFGGIVKCDLVANGVLDAVKEVGLELPLVVRLEGTNVKAGREIIANSGLNVVAADSMADGARKIVELANA